MSDRPPLVTLLTDFGNRDAYVGVMKARILADAPAARIVDLTHEIPPQDVTAAAYVLETAVPWFPPDAVHVAVIDPGVGTERAVLALRTPRGVFVAPDNGLLTPVILDGDAAECVRIEVPPRASATFHGRDVFAPTGGRIAAGAALADLGRAVEPAVVLPGYRAAVEPDGVVRGKVLHVDRFGNAISSIRRADLGVGVEGEVVVRERVLGIPERTYADVAPGAPLALFGSSDHLEIAVRDGSAARSLGIAPGDPVVVRAREGRR